MLSPDGCLQAHKLTGYDLGEYPCHPFLGSSQYFVISKVNPTNFLFDTKNHRAILSNPQVGELRNEYMCGEVSNTRDNNKHKVTQHTQRINISKKC